MKIFVIKCNCCQNNIVVDLVKQTAESETVPAVSVRFKEIVELVCRFDGFTVEQLRRKSRLRKLVFARQKIFWLAKKFSKTTLKEMAAYMGGRDHTTAIHGITAINDQMKYDELLRNEIAALCRQIDLVRYGQAEMAEALD